MLQSIREHTSGWIAGLIIALLIIPFAFWGVGDYFGIIATNYVAKVNGQEIAAAQFQQEYQQTYNRQIQQFRQFLGEQFDPDMINQEQLRREVLDRMINRVLLEQQVRELGYAVNDAQILEAVQSYPQFQENGRFSVERYKTQLSYSGMTPALFESYLGRQLLMEQLNQAVAGTAFVTEDTLAAAVALRNQQRELAWLVVPAERFLGSVEVSDEEVQQYYADNQDRFLTEERVSLRYLELDGREMAAQVEVTEEALRNFYEQRTAAVRQQAERKASHILIAVEGDSEEAWQAAMEKARELRQQLAEGADFAELARRHSDDPGSAEQGGDLSWVARGMMVQPFEEALFALENKGEVSEPVRTSYGVHLIRLEGVRAPDVPSFEAQREQLEEQYRQDQIMQSFQDKAAKLAELTYANPDTLEPAAGELGLEIREVQGVTRDAGTGIAANPAVRQAAFKPELIKERINSDPVELGENRVVVFRISEHLPPQPRPLAEVRDEILRILKRRKAETRAEARAAELAEAVRQGRSLPVLAAEHGLQHSPARFVQRGAPNLPPALGEAAFSAPAPAAGEAVVRSVALRNGDQAVFRLTAVRPGELSALSEEERTAWRRELAARAGATQFRAYVEELRRRADILINEENLGAQQP